MFTGIIESTAEVIKKTDNRLELKRPTMFADIQIGSSIAVSGVCLSVAEFTDQEITFDVVEETWNRSKLGSVEKGHQVNLERSVRADTRLDGHIVQGHIEGIGTWIVEDETYKIELDDELIKFCVQKGSITIDGVSLTIASVSGNKIAVALVPHTLQHTTLGLLNTGDPVNIETDIIGRYLYAFTHETPSH